MDVWKKFGCLEKLGNLGKNGNKIGNLEKILKCGKNSKIWKEFGTKERIWGKKLEIWKHLKV